MLTLWSFRLPKVTVVIGSVVKHPPRMVRHTSQAVAEVVQPSLHVSQAAPQSAQPAAATQIAIPEPQGASAVVAKVRSGPNSSLL